MLPLFKVTVEPLFTTTSELKVELVPPVIWPVTLNWPPAKVRTVPLFVRVPDRVKRPPPELTNVALPVAVIFWARVAAPPVY